MLQAPRGTNDLIGEEAASHRRVEETAREVFESFGYEEIRVPVFEDVRLFQRSVGIATDIVEKEMFTFGSQEEGGETFALRPEFTAGVVRSLVERSVLQHKPFLKLWYIGPAFRKERPQKGRLRQFHQIGAEVFGSPDPLADTETLVVFTTILSRLGVAHAVRLNSIGCPSCRPAYRERLKKEAAGQLAERCDNCKNRYGRNVLRLLDCKNERCRALSEMLPGPLEMLCLPCRVHIDAVQKHAAAEGIVAAIDKRLVRGLDYYTRTVYEVTCPALGAQDAVGAGGRYDGLVEELGGPPTPAVGFAGGIERLVLAMQPPASAGNAAAVFAIYISPDLKERVFRIANRLRRKGISVAMLFDGHSLRSQFRAANRSGAAYALILGEEEARAGKVKVKNLKSSEEKEWPEDDLDSAFPPT